MAVIGELNLVLSLQKKIAVCNEMYRRVKKIIKFSFLVNLCRECTSWLRVEYYLIYACGVFSKPGYIIKCTLWLDYDDKAMKWRKRATGGGADGREEDGENGCYCGGEDWEEGGLEEDKEEGGKILEENTLPAAVRSPRLLVL